MTELREQDLLFTFDDQWRVLKWDDQPAYREGVEHLKHTRAVDFLALRNDAELYFIEVKDFREHRIENKPRLQSGELVDEVAAKVRNTLGGVIWACDRGFDDDALQRFLRPILVHHTKARVVLWLEEDPVPRPVDRSVLGSALKRRLRWLNPHAEVVDRLRPLPGLSVRGVPAAT